MNKYNVWLFGFNFKSTYNNNVTVEAESIDSAAEKAIHEITMPGGACHGWLPDMFKVLKVKIVKE